MILLLTVAFPGIIDTATPPDVVYIGALVDQANPGEEKALELAMEYVNNHPGLLPQTRLEILFRKTDDPQDAYQHMRHVCHLIGQNVAVILGPRSSTATKAAQRICAGLQIPQISPSVRDAQLSVEVSNYPYLLKMSPSDKIQIQVLVQLFRTFSWTRLALLYSSSDYGRNGMSLVASAALDNQWILKSVESFPVTTNPEELDLSAQLGMIKSSGVRVVLLYCESNYAWVVLQQARAQHMLGKGWAWVSTDGTTASKMGDIHGRTQKECDLCDHETVPTWLHGLIGVVPRYGSGEIFNQVCDQQLDGDSLRTFDAFLTVAYGLHSMFDNNHGLQTMPIKNNACMDPGSNKWDDGEVLMSFLKNVSGDGTMNYLNFTEELQTWYTDYDIVKVEACGWKGFGSWSEQEGLRLNITDSIFLGNTSLIPTDLVLDFEGEPLRVLAVINPPFVMEDPDRPGKYTGLAITLLNKITDDLNLKYNLTVKSGVYGRHNTTSGQWQGELAELINNHYDIALGVVVTEERLRHMDLTVAFLDDSVSAILPVTYNTQNGGIFGIFQVFSWPLWGLIFVSTWVIGIFLAMLSFIGSNGFRGRYTQRVNRKDDTYKADRRKMNYHESVWFTVSSIMDQGYMVTPASAASRILAGGWLFFVVIMIAFYTASLAAVLTVQGLQIGISSLSELANQPDVRYGTVRGTAVEELLENNEDDTHIRMMSSMTGTRSWYASPEKAVQDVVKSYRYPKQQRSFIHMTAYLKYAVQQDPSCIIRMLGETFSPAGYALALQKNSSFTASIDEMILGMRKSAQIEAMYMNWSTGLCQENVLKQATYAGGQPLTWHSMSGMFIILAFGVGVSFMVLLLEYIVASCVDSNREKREGREGKINKNSTSTSNTNERQLFFSTMQCHFKNY